MKEGILSDRSSPAPISRADRRRRYEDAWVRGEIRRLARGRDRVGDTRSPRLGQRTVVPRDGRGAPDASASTESASGEAPPAARPRTPIPVRNQLALAIAGLVGFFLGLLEAFERMSYGPTLRLAEVGLAIAVVVGLAGAVHGRARVGNRILVSLLRAGLSGGVFVFVFEGMRLLLKIGAVGGAVASWLWAGILGLLLARLAPAGAPLSTDQGRPSGIH